MIRRLWSLVTRLEARTLAIWIAVVGAPWFFLAIADEVGEGETDLVDRNLLLALRTPGAPGDPIGPLWFEEAMRDITALGGFTILTITTIVAVLLLIFHDRRREALIFAATVILAQISSELLKALYDRPRPSLVTHGSIVYSQSFPSGHSTLAAATFFTLATVVASVETKTRTKVLIFVLAILFVVSVGLSRVYLGVHWPTDVLGGWALGASWALVAWVALGLTRSRARGGRTSSLGSADIVRATTPPVAPVGSGAPLPILDDAERAVLATLRELDIWPGEAISEAPVRTAAARLGFKTERVDAALATLGDKACLRRLDDQRITLTRQGFLAGLQPA